MCITLDSALLTNTHVASWVDPLDPSFTYLGYSNVPDNESGGNNAMLLPFPYSSHPIGLEHLIPLNNEVPNPIRDISIWLESKGKDGQVSRGGIDLGTYKSTNIPFSSGVYSFVSTTAKEILENGYVDLGQGYCNTYGEDCIILLCEFSNDEPEETFDIVVRYKSNTPGKKFLPLLDSHDGRFPDLFNRGFDGGIHQKVWFGIDYQEDSPGIFSLEDLLKEEPKLGIYKDWLPRNLCFFPSRSLGNHIFKATKEVYPYRVQRDVVAECTESRSGSKVTYVTVYTPVVTLIR